MRLIVLLRRACWQPARDAQAAAPRCQPPGALGDARLGFGHVARCLARARRDRCSGPSVSPVASGAPKCHSLQTRRIWLCVLPRPFTDLRGQWKAAACRGGSIPLPLRVATLV
eukprot:SAG31_NODE_13778_length_847_cov_1.393048_2_plen_113_part_00